MRMPQNETKKMTRSFCFKSTPARGFQTLKAKHVEKNPSDIGLRFECLSKAGSFREEMSEGGFENMEQVSPSSSKCPKLSAQYCHVQLPDCTIAQ